MEKEFHDKWYESNDRHDAMFQEFAERVFNVAMNVRRMYPTLADDSVIEFAYQVVLSSIPLNTADVVVGDEYNVGFKRLVRMAKTSNSYVLADDQDWNNWFNSM